VCLKQLLQIVNSVQMQCSFVNFSLQTKGPTTVALMKRQGNISAFVHDMHVAKLCKVLKSLRMPNWKCPKKTAMHLNTAGNGEYTVKNCLQCTCLYFASELLPCKHIFAVHAFEGLSVFDVYSAELSVVTGTVR